MMDYILNYKLKADSSKHISRMYLDNLLIREHFRQRTIDCNGTYLFIDGLNDHLH